MLVFGDHSTMIQREDIYIYNLSSLLEGFPRIGLTPPFKIGTNGILNEMQFDLAYAQYLIQNQNVFMDLMKVMITLYSGLNVYILITHGDGYDYVTESLQKFVQQRYGINSYIIHDMEDWDYVPYNMDFTLNGVYNIDIDKERYSYIIAKINVSQGLEF